MFLSLFIGVMINIFSEGNIYLTILLLLSMVFSLFMGITVDDMVKWNMTYDDMEKDQRESLRLIKNANTLIDKIKTKLLHEHIITKDEVNEILDKP
jgi:disulfide bond formation protein DsbB